MENPDRYSPKAPEPQWCSCRVPDVGRRQVLGGLTAAGALALAGWPGSARAAEARGRSDAVSGRARRCGGRRSGGRPPPG
ncbi:twin-arginine translocation signal domain-containing protein [Actinomadura coerulea]|uniref:twin-arginine translocation signal domain-containing protein n=1 Tax=Actinomadura coerulea TaxID=46159 RepID=UPI00342F1EFA